MKHTHLWIPLFIGFVFCCPLACETGDSLDSDSVDDAADPSDPAARITAVGPIVYQAESYTAQSGCQLLKSSSGYTGTGYMSYGGSGTYLKWRNVNVASGGNYQLTFRYANGGSSTRQATLRINSVDVATLSFAPTGGWSKWATTSTTKSLQAGENTIRVLANSASALSLDKMEVAPLDACPSDPNKTQPGECGCGVPEGTCGSSITLNLRVHIMRNITLNVQGMSMNNDHVTASVVRNELMPELNKIWAQGDVAWRVESIVEENVIKPSNYQELIRIVENAERDENGHSDDARLVPLYAFMDPAHRSTKSQLGTNLFHIYIFPFIGNTSQGNAMSQYGYHTVVGSWSNKHNGGGVPAKRNSTESWSKCVKGSLGRTIAHELGHVLTLQHGQCSSCLMDGCGYSITSSQVNDAQDEAMSRSQ